MILNFWPSASTSWVLALQVRPTIPCSRDGGDSGAPCLLGKHSTSRATLSDLESWGTVLCQAFFFESSKTPDVNIHSLGTSSYYRFKNTHLNVFLVPRVPAIFYYWPSLTDLMIPRDYTLSLYSGRLQVLIHLFLLLTCWDYRHVPSCQLWAQLLKHAVTDGKESRELNNTNHGASLGSMNCECVSWQWDTRPWFTLVLGVVRLQCHSAVVWTLAVSHGPFL